MTSKGAVSKPKAAKPAEKAVVSDAPVVALGPDEVPAVVVGDAFVRVGELVLSPAAVTRLRRDLQAAELAVV